MLFGPLLVAVGAISGALHTAFAWSKGATAREFAILSAVCLMGMMAVISLLIPGSWGVISGR